jgi:hypothetical protein
MDPDQSNPLTVGNQAARETGVLSGNETAPPQNCAGQVWRTYVSRLEEARGVAFAPHGFLKNWRETTAYAGDEDFVFASDKLNGKQPRVPNMLMEDHLPSDLRFRPTLHVAMRASTQS